MTLAIVTRAEEINQQLALAEKAVRDGLQHYIVAGSLLAQQKHELDHGQWGSWLEQNLGIGEREAQRYMQLAEHREQIEQANPTSMSDLSLTAALKQIQQPKKKATAGDASHMLQQLGGNTTTEPEPTPRTETSWTDQQQHKHKKAMAHLSDSQHAGEDALTAGLSSYSIAETLRTAAIDARHAASMWDELSFTFQR